MIHSERDKYGSPFPPEMRGAFCEFEEGEKVRFVEIHYIPYIAEEFLRLEKLNCLAESVLGDYLRLVENKEINSNTHFIYKLGTCLGNPNISDAWIFNENISQYEEVGFVSFNDLINFCEHRWQIGIKDFVSRDKTHIPE